MKKLLAIMIAVTLALGFSACSKDASVDPVTTDSAFIPDLVSAGTNVEPIVVSDATLDKDMYLMNEMNPTMVNNGQMFGGITPMFQFRDIFKKMKLTQDQLTQVQALMKAHIDCEKAAREAFRAAVEQIITDANAARKAILDQVKAGTLDRKAAALQIRDLNKATQQQIAATGANETLRKALKDCTETLLTGIRAVLTTDQQVLWDKWVKRFIFMGGPSTGTGNHP